MFNRYVQIAIAINKHIFYGKLEFSSTDAIYVFARARIYSRTVTLNYISFSNMDINFKSSMLKYFIAEITALKSIEALHNSHCNMSQN